MAKVTASQVERLAAKAREATARRDEAIRAMVAQGASLREVAQAAGLSHTGVAKIAQRSPMEVGQ